jgi:hypothetical protein
MEATTIEWPLVDPQYVLNELKSIPSFYKSYKIWTKLNENQKSNVLAFWKTLSEDIKQNVASDALQKFNAAQSMEKERQEVSGSTYIKRFSSLYVHMFR